MAKGQRIRANVWESKSKVTLKRGLLFRDKGNLLITVKNGHVCVERLLSGDEHLGSFATAPVELPDEIVNRAMRLLKLQEAMDKDLVNISSQIV